MFLLLCTTSLLTSSHIAVLWLSCYGWFAPRDPHCLLNSILQLQYPGEIHDHTLVYGHSQRTSPYQRTSTLLMIHVCWKVITCCCVVVWVVCTVLKDSFFRRLENTHPVTQDYVLEDTNPRTSTYKVHNKTTR